MSHIPYSAPKSTMWLWGVGTIADALMIQTFGLVMPIFNTGFGIDSVMLSWIIIVPRLVDGLLGPFIGHFSDNTHTRWGRRKPFLVAMSFAGALVLAGIWWANPAWPKAWQTIYLIAFATVYYTTWGIFSMTHYALGYELTDDYHERARVMAIRTVYLQIVVLAVGWTYWLALRPVFGGEINGIRWISAGMALLVIITGLVPVFACTERFAHAKPTPTPIFQALREAFRIGPFVTYLALRFFAMFGIVVFNSLVFYINVYYVCAGNKDLAMKIVGIGTMLTVVVSVAALPFVPKLSKKIGKRMAVIIGSAIALFQACIVPFLYTPHSRALQFIADTFHITALDVQAVSPYLQLIAALLLAPLVAVAIVLRDAIVPDICDVDELENGKRREGLFTAVVNFVYKMEVSLCVVLVGYLLRFAAFDPKIHLQPDFVLTRLQWFTFVPNIVFAFLALILAVKFPITEAYMANVHAQLEERRKAGLVP